MQQGEAKVGWRVRYNALARRTRGIGTGIRGESRLDMVGTITVVGEKNSMGSEVISVRWDDGWEYALSPCWVKRAWASGGYTHGKRKKD
jgi:hypothetical protein